jgi:hypothetical protein
MAIDNIFIDNSKFKKYTVSPVYNGLSDYGIFYTSFLLKKIIEGGKNRQWITTGIKTSCNPKRQLCLLSKDSNDINLIKYYK